jgi:hypothetical protein
MTYLNVTTTKAEVTVSEESGVVIAVVPTGPQGPIGPPGPIVDSLGSIPDVDTSAVTDGSVLVYNSTVSKFTANSVWTTTSLTDGGNF